MGMMRGGSCPEPERVERRDYAVKTTEPLFYSCALAGMAL